MSNSSLVSGLSEASRARSSLVEVSQDSLKIEEHMLGESEFKERWLFMLARGLEGETVLVRGAPSNCLLSCMSCSSPAIGLLENHS